jgi:hypothetical protein
VSTLRDKFA